ncbi:copper chaperone [Luteibacter rhizovicinus]|uniref:Copper chaperone n=1 Tax=Luteibacter rhizovicinus TaxID=242606 RepID=A0A4R3Z0I6_9GAMM|nr:heavy-metal-associated domain-containing protein [Luteibacter rhizovicinus]TCV97718.1 copper chaperone [Luteibacter rhizovicinus]
MHRFYIPNMTCGGCAKSVTKALLSVDSQARIETDPSAREVRVDSALDESVFLAVLSEAGYPDKRVTRSDDRLIGV